MQKIKKIVFFLLLYSLVSGLAFPAYAGFELVNQGNSGTGEGAVYRRDDGCTVQVNAASLYAWGDPAGMSGGKAEGASSEESSERSSGETQVATISGSTPTSYTVTREKVGDTQTITRTDGTAGTRDTYEIGGNTTQIVNTYEDGSEITTSFNSDGTTITTTNGQSWREWHNASDSSRDESFSSTEGSSNQTPGTNAMEPLGGTTPTGPRDDSHDPIPGGREPDPSIGTNLYEFKHDNVTDKLTATGTTKTADGREVKVEIIIPPVEPVPKPENPEKRENPENPDGKGKDGSNSQTEGTNGTGRTVTVGGKTYPVNKDGTVDTSTGTPGTTDKDVYQKLQKYTEEFSKIEGGKKVTVDKPGSISVTQEFEDGKKKTWTVTGDDKIEYDYEITNEDGTKSVHHRKISIEHSVENRPTFVGYDWTIENLTDQYSPFYMSPTSFTAPGMTERQYEGGPIDHGGLLPVGEGYIKMNNHGAWGSAEDYWFVNYGDHTATVTPWWNIDVYEVWDEEVEDSDQGGQAGGGTYTEHHEVYCYSYKESRPPRIFKFNIGLVCLDCPIPAKGYRVCLGDNCDCDGTGNELMTVCDENHTGELDIENRVELEQ